VLAAQRSPDSYIAGGVAINREATIAHRGDAMPLEWVTDSAFRFFSTQPDELFGYVLHPVDLATNKASAAADRRVPRDIVDLVTIHETILPLGAVLCAAVGKYPGVTPEGMLAEIIRHSRFTAEEFQALATEEPIDVPGLHRRIRNMIEDAESFVATLPSDAVGVIFMDGEKAVQPDVNALGKYQRNPGAPPAFGRHRPKSHGQCSITTVSQSASRTAEVRANDARDRSASMQMLMAWFR
jgi:hypothetical protein